MDQCNDETLPLVGMYSYFVYWDVFFSLFCLLGCILIFLFFLLGCILIFLFFFYWDIFLLGCLHPVEAQDFLQLLKRDFRKKTWDFVQTDPLHQRRDTKN